MTTSGSWPQSLLLSGRHWRLSPQIWAAVWTLQQQQKVCFCQCIQNHTHMIIASKPYDCWRFFSCGPHSCPRQTFQYHAHMESCRSSLAAVPMPNSPKVVIAGKGLFVHNGRGCMRAITSISPYHMTISSCTSWNCGLSALQIWRINLWSSWSYLVQRGWLSGSNWWAAR